MTNQHTSIAGETGASAAADSCAAASQGKVAPTQKPYLKVFGTDIGVLEFELLERTTVIGRRADADVTLPGPMVSRVHATIVYEDGRFSLSDTGSTAGTTVNGTQSKCHTLSHGDSIQIATYVLQFRTHREAEGAATVAARVKRLLGGEYNTLPSTMRLSQRVLSVSAGDVFNVGDTLRIGHGGLLVPTCAPPAEGACLELSIQMSGRVNKRYLGEIVGVVEEGGTHWMCVKLHTLSREALDTIVDGAEEGPWIDVVAT